MEKKFIMKLSHPLAKEGEKVYELYRTARFIYVAKKNANNSISVPLEEEQQWLEPLQMSTKK